MSVVLRAIIHTRLCECVFGIVSHCTTECTESDLIKCSFVRVLYAELFFFFFIVQDLFCFDHFLKQAVTLNMVTF